MTRISETVTDKLTCELSDGMEGCIVAAGAELDAAGAELDAAGAELDAAGAELRRCGTGRRRCGAGRRLRLQGDRR